MDRENLNNTLTITGGTAMNYAENIINKNIEKEKTMSVKHIDIAVTKVVTGKIALYNSHLFDKWAYEPLSDNRFNRPETPKRKKRYSTGIIIPKTEVDTLRNVEIGIKKAIKLGRPIFGGDIPDTSSLQLPLNDGDKEWVTNVMYKNSFYMYANSDFKPGVVDKSKEKLYPCEIPDGKYARVSIMFTPYNVNGKMGVSCKLNNVQILDGIYRPSWSTAEEDFD